MYFIPIYGPNWKFKVLRMSPFLWHVRAISEWRFRKKHQIAGHHVAPWNRRRLPKRST